MNGPAPSSRGNFTPPPRAVAPSANGAGPAPLPPAGSRFSPRNWRVPTRLYAILLIPVVVGLVMGGFQVKGSVDTWREAEDAEHTARLVRAALTYGQRLIEERDVSAAPLLRGDRNDPAVANARAATDRAARAFDAAAKDMPHKEGLERRLTDFRRTEPGLTKLRAAAYTSRLGGVRTEEGYVAIEHPLMEFANELGLGTGNITSYGRTVYAISLAKAAASLQRSIGMHLLVEPGPRPADLNRQRVALSSYAYLEGIATEEYRSGGTEEDVATLSRATARLKEDGAKAARKKAAAAKAKGEHYVPPPATDRMVAALAALPGTAQSDRQAIAAQGVTQENWWATTTARCDTYRQIESNLADRAVDEAAGIADDARRSTFVTGAVVLVALLAAVVLAGLMARQMSRSMRRLRTAAFGIAEQRLPMLVDQLSRTAPGRVDTRVQPLPISSTDEIGEVARAFDQVHREAVRLAAEQAMLRGNVNAIFANLSRRNESLIEGQLALISDLENHETDPDQLASLFRLDHLATRMRRNGENLLVLSGKEPGRRWDQPVPLVDVLRAASSEVEQYHRIELVGVSEAEIHGLAVTDLVHLLAELLENATAFSSPETRVRVTATRLPDSRIMIEIHDQGIGLTPQDFADINHRLAKPPAVDAAVSQRMGLFVVGRLAERHGIRVQLRPSAEHSGTTSLVMLPDAITHGGGGEPQHDEAEFTVSSIIPEQQAYPAEPLRTAAELGFDDSRYADSTARDLDRVARSLLRGERHAALGTGPQPGQEGADQAAYGTRAGGPAYDARGTAPGYGAAAAGSGYDAGAAGSAYDAQAYGAQYDAHGGAQAAFGDRSQHGYEQPPRSPYDAGYAGMGSGPSAAPSSPLESPYPEAAGADRTGAGQALSGSYDGGPHQGEWAHQGSFQAAHPTALQAQAESSVDADGNGRDRVGFDRSGPAPSSSHELTDAGLPRRGPAAGGGGDESSATGRERADDRQDPGGRPHSDQVAPGGDPAAPEPVGSGWHSANDERWQRAEALRAPRAGGVTSSGLPRRVPRANLVEGTAEQTPQGGVQVSRAPEDVRGRLSRLVRGVQRGRNEGSNSNGLATEDPHNGHSGHDSTYNQER
ncbi:ATPase [Streptomyces sulfonofaciens]|uniref:histidine kinase n=1 Tax=Streptomyces sulfonofaciens TaxID=68272 RepID=A0A919L8L3_9ACTN|nr:ATPase [Streptomyces sulfonofaciens]